MLWALGRRSRQVLLLAALTGLTTGLVVAGFDELTGTVLFDHVYGGPLWLQTVGPLAGLLLALVILRWLASGASPSTADEYIKNFHQHDQRLPLRPVPGRILASVATLGLGGPLGYEGPSIYLGAAIGSALQARFSRFFSREDAKALLVAGAAAGVAAIFKAPATGALFALEVPYQRDLARRMLLPALIGAAISYVTFVSVTTTTSPLLAVRGAPGFDLADLGGAALLGLAAGGGARVFARMVRLAKALAATTRLGPMARAVVAGVILGVFALVSHYVFHQPLTLGPGYHTITWAIDPRHGLGLVILLLVMRAVSSVTVLAGGGAGGLFIPLVVEGALIGRVFGSVLGQSGSSLFPIIGVAAFLGAGYRVPLAAVMFVAESTGRPEFVVPGLIAAVVAQLVMGNSSVTEYQQSQRGGNLERRFALPLSRVLETDVRTVPPDATIAEFFDQHLVGTRQKTVAVVDGAKYLGLARLDDLIDVPRETWAAATVSDIMRTDGPVAAPQWTIHSAVIAMEAADTDVLPVVDATGLFVGLTTTGDIFKLDEILEQTEEG
jgi:CIC family chloride channel protein